jgi:flagellar hook-basal body complex protein FliE
MVPAISPVPPSPPSPPGAPSTPAPGQGGFASLLGNAVNSLLGAQTAANQASLGVAAGTASVSQMVMATDQAQLATQLTVALQNAALTAFNKVLAI